MPGSSLAEVIFCSTFFALSCADSGNQVESSYFAVDWLQENSSVPSVVLAIVLVAITVLCFSRTAKRKCTDFLSDEYIQELFKKFDRDNNNTLDKEEVKKLVVSILSSEDPGRVKITKEDHALIMSLIDANHDGKVNLDELKRSLREWLPVGGSRTALVVVDLQNDFLTGSLVVAGGEEAVDNTNKLREAFKFDVIAHTRDWHPANHCSFAETWGAELFSKRKIPSVGSTSGSMIDQVMWPTHCVQNTHGAKFHPKLKVATTDHIVDKGTKTNVDSYSGFFDNSKGSETELRAYLKHQGISEVYVVGVAFDYCVGSTAIDAADCGFTAYVVEDCTKSVTPDGAAAMKEKLRAAGVTVVTSAEMTGSGFAQIREKKRVGGFLEAVRRLARRRALEEGPFESHHVLQPDPGLIPGLVSFK